jgi:HlyD family secretion protein
MALMEKNTRRRDRWVAAVLAVLVAVVLLASFVGRRDTPVPVRSVAVARGAIRSVISVNGKVEPAQNFEAHAPVPTTVKRVLVKEGAHVKRGQLLVQLDDADARSQAARALAQLKSAQADVHAVESGGTQEEVLDLQSQLVKAQTERDAAERNLNALKALEGKGAASPGEVKDAENNLQRSTAQLQSLQKKQQGRYSKPEVARVDARQSEAQAAYDAAQDVLQKSNVRAPFDGIVYNLPVHQGVYVPAGELLLQEADLSKVVVRAFVDEPDIGRLAPGNKVEITWDAIPGRTWQGTVNSVPSTVKLRGSRNIGETMCSVENQDLKLLPNVNVGVTIIVAQHDNALIVPREAVHLDDSKPYVFEIAGDRVKRRDVQVAVSNLTQVEIVGGVDENDALALSVGAAKPLRDGSAVKVAP